MSPSPEGSAETSSKAAVRKRKARNPWAGVDKGQDVILEKGNERFAGTVDDITDDGEIVWIKSSMGERRLFHMGDGYGLLLHST